jgi:Transglycosylase-like domain
MSSAMNARWVRVVLVVACVLAIGLVSALPAMAAEGKGKGKDNAAAAAESKSKGKSKGKQRRRGLYVVKDGTCDIKKLPKRAIRQWTPAGEDIVHKVAYGQGLQQIAHKYGFKGDDAFRVLWDVNPQLKKLELERSGITIRVPACRARVYRRKLPKPPPPPEPEEEEEATPEPEDDDSGSSGGSGDSDPPQSDAPAVPSDSVWDQLAECESGGNWSINTGNGYYGGLQFSESSWHAVGGSGLPHQHSREEQIKRGEMLQAQQGWGAWPSCSAKLGLN